MPKYYALEKKQNTAELYIFGNITSYPWKEKDRDAYGIVKELQEMDADVINVHLNSTGGSVGEGLAIYNVLKNSKAQVVTYCDGFACSAASVIFMAGDRRIMNDASLLMIHNAWTYGEGNSAELRKQAEDLDKINQASVKAYMSRIAIKEEELKKLMDDETWLTAEESVKYGFATETVEETREGINQSAMWSIREKIMNSEAITGECTSKELDIDEIVEKLSEKIKLLFEKKEEKPEDSTGFGAFFNQKKGE